ncbi:MAG TPA: hypothetical protein VGG41_15170 [Solirubrobacteraceae bacterium]|jgi:hypothetical protein
MRSESYKAWIDAMPIDDVRQRIERLERKLADLHVLERLYEDRNGAPDAAPESPSPSEAQAATDEGGDDAATESEESIGEGGEDTEPEAGSGEGGGGWTQGEGSPEHG